MRHLRSTEARDWREGRRLRAWELHQQGWKQHQIAAALGVTQGAVSQWLRRATEGGGIEALRRRKAPGATPRLTADQRAQLPELLAPGAAVYGFRGEVWTCARVAEVIRKEFGVSYHPAHVSRLLKALRLSLQKPARRADQQDEEAIRHWKEERWPELKKGP
jgi:transposase